jgi:protection of telomeres protein 1
MRPSLPPKFVDIGTARSREGRANVIGVVVDVLPKTRSGGSSFVITFTLKDADLDGQTWDGLKVRFFSDNEALVPDIRQYDVLLLRNILVSTGYLSPAALFPC